MSATLTHWQQEKPVIDSWLMIFACLLIGFGLVMMTSASIEVAYSEFQDPFYYFKKQSVFLLLGLVGGVIVYSIPLAWWEMFSGLAFIGALFLLTVVLIPGVGITAGGGTRWINLGFMGLQASEPSKVLIVIFIAGLLSRNHDLICGSLKGFILPFLLMVIPVFLLLSEPDFGAVVVLMFAVMGMIFLAGAKFWHFLLSAMLVVAAGAGAILTSEYRIKRVQSFIQALSDPFHEDVVFDTGYQLAQALIGFGRGEWLGLGLGNSIQKMYFLPDAHNDFIFAIIAEELGVVFAMLLLLLFAGFIFRIMLLARRNEIAGNHFAAYVAYGFGFIFFAQVIINVSVNMGLLPTKGLTLPFISSGGSSLLTCMAMLGLLLRIDLEGRELAAFPPAGRATGKGAGS